MEDFEAKAEALKKKMLGLGVAHFNLIKGCSELEISTLEKENDVVFPHSYKMFLKHFGHGLGGVIMKEIDILYDEISGLTDFLKNKVLIEEGDPLLPEKAFVFSGRYGEQFLFLDASGLIEEPPTMYYSIDDNEFTKKGKSVFDLIESEIELSIAIKNHREKLRNRRQNRQNKDIRK